MAVDRRISKTNDAILDAFITLAQTRPLSKITITALANQANISRKTFYDRYSSIDELILSLREFTIERFKNVFIPVEKEGVSDNEVIAFLQFSKKNKELIRILEQDSPEFLRLAVEDRKEDFARYLVTAGKFDEQTAETMAP